MGTGRFVAAYVEHGSKAGAVRKITVSIPLHVLRLLSDERTRRQVNNLRHATNSDLLVEAFLHAFTGQPLPTDEELKRTMATTKKTAKKAARKSPAKKAVRKTTAKKAATKRPVAKKAATKRPAAKKAVRKSSAKKAVKKAVKRAPAKKAAAKKAPRKAAVKKTAAAKVARATRTSKK
jgi:MetJ family transcriptional regulator, methionine regulon repressor